MTSLAVPPPRERYRPTARALAETIRAHEGGLAAHLAMRAYEYAAVHHDRQTRLNGDPMLSHSVAVAHIVAGVRPDGALVAAALLHDVGWNDPVERGSLRLLFGDDVTDLIEAADDLDRPSHPERDLTSVDQRVLILKLSDRLHNLHTIAPLKRESQLLKAQHTLRVLVPLAERAGLPLITELRSAASDALNVLEGTGTCRRPNQSRTVSNSVVTLAARLLPARHRQRWTQEWAAELAALPCARSRMYFALDVALGTPTLALTLRGTPDPGGEL